MRIIGFMFSLLLWTAGVETAQAVLKSDKQQHLVREGEAKLGATMRFQATSAGFPFDASCFPWDHSPGIGALVHYAK